MTPSQTNRAITVLFAGGGTGGHIYPNVAILERLRDASADAGLEVVPHFLVSDRPGDAQTMAKLGVPYSASPVKPLPSARRPWRAVGFLLAWRRAVSHCRALMRRENVAAVVATGGFVSGPAIVAARELGIPRAMVNLDAVPGRANRSLHGACTKVFTAFAGPHVRAHLAHATPIGLPMRRLSIGTGAPAESLARLGLEPQRPLVFVTGATHGAESLIRTCMALCEHPDRVAELRDWQVLHQCGTFDVATLQAAYDRGGVRAKVVAYLDRMGDAWHAADIAVSRAGAGSVAEAWANATPSIFLPNPYHADAHQRANAQPLVEAGGAVVVTDHLDAERTLGALVPELFAMVRDPARRAEMKRALERTRPSDGAEVLARWIVDTIATKHR